MRIWWESSDKEHSYDHTHVMVNLMKRVQFRKTAKHDRRRPADFLDFGEHGHPNFKPVNTAKHWENLLNYDDKNQATLENHMKFDDIDVTSV